MARLRRGYLSGRSGSAGSGEPDSRQLGVNGRQIFLGPALALAEMSPRAARLRQPDGLPEIVREERRLFKTSTTPAAYLRSLPTQNPQTLASQRFLPDIRQVRFATFVVRRSKRALTTRKELDDPRS